MSDDNENKIELLATSSCYICGMPLNLTEEDLKNKSGWVSLNKDSKLIIHPYCKKYYVHNGTLPKKKSKKSGATILKK